MNWEKKRFERVAVAFDDYIAATSKEEKEIQDKISAIINAGQETWRSPEDVDLEGGSEYVFQSEPFILELGTWDAKQGMFYTVVNGKGRFIERGEVYAVYR